MPSEHAVRTLEVRGGAVRGAEKCAERTLTMPTATRTRGTHGIAAAGRDTDHVPPCRDACTGAITKSTYAAPQHGVLTRRSFLKRQRVLQNKVLEKASEESE